MRLPKPTYEQIGTAVAATIAFEAELAEKDPEIDPHEVERLRDNHFISMLAVTVGGDNATDAIRERVTSAIMARPERRTHLRDFFDDKDTEEIANIREELEKIANGQGGTA
ncbi:MAG: hypothetical protein ACRD3E_07165 [Terriglobales bacterium]